MEVLANTENQTAINNVKHISGKYMNVALKKKKCWACNAKNIPNIHITVTLAGRIYTECYWYE